MAAKKDHSVRTGWIAAGMTLLGYALIFPFHKVGHYLVGGIIAGGVGLLVKTMSTPLKGLDKHAQTKSAIDVTNIKDEYARGVVEKGLAMLDALKFERNAINEAEFTRQIDTIRAALDQVLHNIIETPAKAHVLRKMNSYYLPTACKMLQGYRTARKQGASPAIIADAKADVLDILHKLHTALQTMLDKMVSKDLEDLDIESDVFEQMLKSDGLQQYDTTDALRSSAHAAAKEMPVSGVPTLHPTNSD